MKGVRERWVGDVVERGQGGGVGGKRVLVMSVEDEEVGVGDARARLGEESGDLEEM